MSSAKFNCTAFLYDLWNDIAKKQTSTSWLSPWELASSQHHLIGFALKCFLKWLKCSGTVSSPAPDLPSRASPPFSGFLFWATTSGSTKDNPPGIFHEKARHANYTACIRMEDPHSQKLPKVTFISHLTLFVLGGSSGSVRLNSSKSGVRSHSIGLHAPPPSQKAGCKMESQHYNHMLQILYFSFLLWINSSNKFSLHLCEALQIEPQKQKLITF